MGRQSRDARLLLLKLAAELSGMGRMRLVLACLTGTALIAVVDTQVNPLLAMSVFYLLPVLVAAARDAGSGMAVAAVSAATWCSVDLLRHTDTYGSAAIPVVNAVSRLAVFGILVWLVSALRQELEREADMGRLDGLTGVANTRSFYEAAEAARRVLARTRRPLTLAYLDVDDFKLINDRLGHSAGDEVLRHIGQVLTAGVREVDTVARLGGDEFVLLLPDTDAQGAALVLERVRRRLGEQVLLRDDANGSGGHDDLAGTVCLSIGTATFCEPVESVDAMVATADRRMYEAKRTAKSSGSDAREAVRRGSP